MTFVIKLEFINELIRGKYNRHYSSDKYEVWVSINEGAVKVAVVTAARMDICDENGFRRLEVEK